VSSSRVGWAAVAAAAVCACGAPQAPPELHPVRARVLRVEAGGRLLAVHHEAIPGEMAAMEMTLPVADPAQARGLAPGDAIRFELVVSERGAHADRIERLPPDAVLELGEAP
jgi:Cu/Ag efflux protein CusF